VAVAVRISLFYNPGAGEGESLNHIRKTLERQGHTVVQVVKEEADLRQLLATPTDLVVAAGGDGTVSAVARVLAGQGTPLAILPTGTANNIARSVGTHASLEDASRRWRTSDPQEFDVGVVVGDWGESRFVEGVGAGVIPAGIKAMHAEPPDEQDSIESKLEQAIAKYRAILSQSRPRPTTLALDGVVSHGDFLLVEVLNIRSIGPNLELSHEASPSDGLLTVVTATEKDREAISDYLKHLLSGQRASVSLAARHVRRVDLSGWEEIHVDDELLTVSPNAQVSIRIEPGALEILP
jgi:diacylglycerol kinase family enzyme